MWCGATGSARVFEYAKVYRFLVRLDAPGNCVSSGDVNPADEVRLGHAN